MLLSECNAIYIYIHIHTQDFGMKWDKEKAAEAKGQYQMGKALYCD